MSEMIQIPNGAMAQVANYSEQVISQYSHNPLIEALPPIMSKDQVIQNIASYPYFNPEERMLDSHYRFHMIQQLYSYFQPLPIHIDLESRISRLIRQGYINRNPLTPHYSSTLVQGYEDIQKGKMSTAVHMSPSGLTIIGVSGMGKSSAINRILQMMPQVICHSKYKNQNLNLYQTVFLKLECPPDGSIRGLINNFFVELDKLLGTKSMDKFGKNGRLSATSLIPIVAQIARNSNLGLLVVDEIQNLSLAKSGGIEQMLSFFVALSNSIGLPVILIGTPKAISLFSEFRQARRGSGQGDMMWEPMKKDEQGWKLFLDGMWDYQWLRKPVPLSVELSDAIYEASCGITDIAVKTFIMSQIRAITSGTEELTPGLIKNVAKESFKLIQPMLYALRSGNALKIAKFGDISPINIEGFVSEEKSKLDLGNMLKNFQNAHKEQKINMERVKQEAIIRLTILGMVEKDATFCVNKLISSQPQLRDLKEIVQEAYKMYLNIPQSNLRESQTIDEKNDLRKIVKAGKERGLSAYQSLKDAGYIVSDFVAG